VGGLTCRVKKLPCLESAVEWPQLALMAHICSFASVHAPIFSKLRLAFPIGLIESLLISRCSYSHGLGWWKIPLGAVLIPAVERTEFRIHLSPLEAENDLWKYCRP